MGRGYRTPADHAPAGAISQNTAQQGVREMRLPKQVETVADSMVEWTKPFRNLEVGLAIFCFFSPVLMIVFDSCRYTDMDLACRTSDGEFEHGIRAAISHYWDMPASVTFYVPLTVAVMMFLVRATIRTRFKYNWVLGLGLLLLVVFNHDHFRELHYLGVFAFFTTNVVVLVRAFAKNSLKIVVLAGAVAFFFAGNLIDTNWTGNWALWAEWASLLVIAAHFILIAWTSDRTYSEAPVAPSARNTAKAAR
jgi:NADH:ubiquinone oxidoreductase subunit 6 (subunit J)